jgi:hypothetical protein
MWAVYRKFTPLLVSRQLWVGGMVANLAEWPWRNSYRIDDSHGKITHRSQCGSLTLYEYAEIGATGGGKQGG